MNRYLHALLCAVSLCIGLLLGGFVSGMLHDATTLPPCPTEDSVQCYWDSSESGNGLGVDVVNP